MSDYKIIKDGDYIVGCSTCDSEVPLSDFSSDRETKFLCELCANTIGHRHTEVTKALLAQMLNVMRFGTKP